jgi:hypothetical protein
MLQGLTRPAPAAHRETPENLVCLSCSQQAPMRRYQPFNSTFLGLGLYELGLGGGTVLGRSFPVNRGKLPRGVVRIEENAAEPIGGVGIGGLAIGM